VATNSDGSCGGVGVFARKEVVRSAGKSVGGVIVRIVRRPAEMCCTEYHPGFSGRA